MGRRHVNQETGEIIQEPDFIKVYINDLCNVKGVTGLQMNIFHFMLKHMNDHNEVSYGKSAKDRFCKKHDTSLAAFNNNIKALIAAGLIERVNRGEFRVNKKYAVKVDWDRVQSIIWVSTYTKNGKTEEITFSEMN
ncbi:MAG: replication/maintenance protein RepL [Candidatus Phlomobacter fragariae]